MLTKFDIAAIRSADTLCVYLDKANPKGMVRLIKRADTSKPFATDIECVMADCPVSLYGHRYSTAIDDGGKCFAHISFYHSQHTAASTMFKSLRVGDEVSFEFYPDEHSNGYTKAANLHADALYMHVKRGDKRLRFEVDVSICPDNSARMCSVASREYALAV